MQLGISLFLMAAACVIGATRDLPPVVTRAGQVRNETVVIPALDPAKAYSVQFSVSPLSAFGERTRVSVSLSQASTTLVNKTLHLGDADLFAMFHAPRRGPANLAISIVEPLAGPARFRLRINRWPGSPQLRRRPDRQRQDSNPIALGQRVFASAHEAPCLPLPETPLAVAVEGAAGEQSYRFEFAESSPKLACLPAESMERDHLPVDVSVLRRSGGKPETFEEGADPATSPHEVHPRPGNEFRPPEEVAAGWPGRVKPAPRRYL